MTKGAKISLIVFVLIGLSVAAYFLYFKWYKPKQDEAAEAKRLAEAALLEKATTEPLPVNQIVASEVPAQTPTIPMFQTTSTKVEAEPVLMESKVTATSVKQLFV